MEANHVAILLMVVILWLLGWVLALLSIASPRLTLTPLLRGLWIAIAIIFPIIGPVVWFVGARQYFLGGTPVPPSTHPSERTKEHVET